MASGGGECTVSQETGREREEKALKGVKGDEKEKTNGRMGPPWTRVQTEPCSRVPAPADKLGGTLVNLCFQAMHSGWSWGPRERLVLPKVPGKQKQAGWRNPPLLPGAGICLGLPGYKSHTLREC